MKQKTTILKTIVLAAAMMLGEASSVWAGATSTIYHRATTDADGATVWNASDDIKAGEWTGNTESAGVDATYGLKMSSSSGTMAITKSFSVNAGSTLTYDIVWDLGNRTANSGYPLSKLYIGDKIHINWESRNSKNGNTTLFIGEDQTALGTLKGSTSSHTVLTIHFVVNTYSNTISEFTIDGTKTDESALNWTIPEGKKSLLSETFATFNSLTLAVEKSTNVPTSYLQSVKVQETLPDTPYYFFTVQAVAGSTPIKTFAVGSAAEGETYNTYIPKVISEGGQYYVLDDASNPNLTNYYASYTMGTSDVVNDINYTLNSNVVYFGEWEDVSANKTDVVENQSSLSEGKGRKFNTTGYTMSLTFTVPVAGKYQIEIPFQNTVDDRIHQIFLDGTEEGNEIDKTTSISGTYGTYSEELTLAAGTHTIYIKCWYQKTAAFDYLMVTLNTPYISDVDNLGYTFSSTLPLDFTGTTVEAYTAAYNSTTKKVDLTRVYKVPANTGLFIKGSADDIPVLTGDADDMGTNNLVAVSTATTVAATSGTDNVNTNYVLALADKTDSSKGVLFLKANATSVGAGKAYLQIPTASAPAAPQLQMVFDNGDVTTINTVHGSQLTENGYYNLNGQRVTNPTKGLYIVNGKKVIIK